MSCRNVFFLVSIAAVGCGEGLPAPERIVEPRMLAMQASVVDSPLDPVDPDAPTRVEAMPFDTLRLRPLWGGPEGILEPEVFEPMWIVCALPVGLAPFSCLSEATPLELAALPECPSVSLTASLQEVPSPCLLSEAAVPEFAVPLSTSIAAGADLEVTLIAGPPEGTDTRSCARALLRGDSDPPADCLYGVEVLPVGPKTRLFSWLAGEALPEEPGPDTNPRIETTTLVLLDAQGEPLGEPFDISDGRVIEVERGTSVRVEVETPAGDLQTYAVPLDAETVSERRELSTGSWLLTWGSIVSTSSVEPRTSNTWTLEPDDADADGPPDGVAHLFYVVRDGRKGVAWTVASVRVVEPA